MVLDELRFINVLKGKRVKLTLEDASFLGVIQRINPNKTLVLADVECCSKGCKVPGWKMFFGHEIVNVEFIREEKADSRNVHKLEEHLNVKTFQPYRKTITSLCDDADEEYINFVVIDEFHGQFGHALMDIKKQQVVGVGADGLEVLKQGRLCWLQIATKKKIYLFDVLLLGARAFKNGLSMILESKHILKVVHDCRGISSCLFAQFGVTLNNVFDTQVADVMCFYSETGGLLPSTVSTLQEVVSVHLKVPSSQLLSLRMKSQLTKEEAELWSKRPCPLPMLKVMALSVIHLMPLRLVLLDSLMTDYMTLVDSYLKSSHFAPDDLAHVNMKSVYQLPGELRRLEQIRRERQEHASSHYPVTKEGLLDRFHPRNQPDTQTPPLAKEQSRTQPDSATSATVEAPPPKQEGAVLHRQPTNSSRDVDDAQGPGPAAASQNGEERSPSDALPLGAGRGRAEALMEMAGRGRPFGLSDAPPLPTFGRGFLLQSIRDVAALSSHNVKPTQEDVPPPRTTAVDTPCFGEGGLL